MVENEKFSQTMFRHGSRRRFSFTDDSVSDDELLESDDNTPLIDLGNNGDEILEDQHIKYSELRSLRPLAAKVQRSEDESV